MVTSPKTLMKRTYLDGQYIVVRKSDWLLQVTIEGPFGERASKGFFMWLNLLPALNKTLQYILLDVSNIGPISGNLYDSFIDVIRNEKVGGIALFGNERTKENLEKLITQLENEEKIAYFNDLRKAFLHPEQLHKKLNTPPLSTP